MIITIVSKKSRLILIIAFSYLQKNHVSINISIESLLHVFDL